MTPLLETLAATVRYPRSGTALDGVSLQVAPGETLGVVGESGAGKSTLAAAVLGLVPLAAGSVRFDGGELPPLGTRARRALSGQLQAVFQDPYSSLNPARTILQTLAEPLLVQRSAGRSEVLENAHAMLLRVGLEPDAAGRRPAAFSGGQRQRIAIARALMCSPRLVICDEPVSALDASVQAQVLNLLAGLQAERGLSYLFISHDRDVVDHMADRVAVLRSGRVVEAG